MKLTYWVSEMLNDSSAYNIRMKTKGAVIEQLIERGLTEQQDGKWEQRGDGWTVIYGKPHKVTVEYADGLDLLRQCLGEGGVNESDGSERSYHADDDAA